MFVRALEVDVDHVHLFVEIPPQLSVGGAVRMYKSLSARYLLQRFPDLRKAFWGGAVWSPSYFVRTVGDGVTAEMVRRYIDTHEEKAALGPAQAELYPKGALRPKG